eukprot:gene25777-32269_t
MVIEAVLLFVTGNLRLWDRRHMDKPIMSKTSAHSQPVLTVAWHPSSEGVLATGSRDKTVRIWDNNLCSLDTASHFEGGEPVCTHTIHTSAAVGRVMWRSGEDQYRNQIASIAAHTAAGHVVTGAANTNFSADASGNVSIWDLNHPNIPVCVLQGHDVSDCCVDFSWIESLAAETPGSGNGTPTGGPGGAGTTSVNSSGPKSGKKQNSKSYNFANYQRSLEVQQLKEHHQSQQAITQYVLSVSSGKDGGRLLVQDMRSIDSVLFPYDHISPSVVAISSQGDAAFHRGRIDPSVRSSPSGATPSILFPSSSSSSSSGSVKETSKSGVPLSRSIKAGEANLTSSPVAGRTAAGQNGSGNLSNVVHQRNGSFKDVDALHTGAVVLGLADIDNLEECEGIRKERGAEGGVFDPALIYLLARSYSLAHTLYGSEEATTRLREGSYSCSAAFSPPGVPSSSGGNVEVKELTPAEEQAKRDQEAYTLQLGEFTLRRLHYDDAMEACRTNLKVALAAGLKCRASVWSSLASLIPAPEAPKPPLLATTEKIGVRNSKSRESSSTNLMDILYPNAMKSPLPGGGKDAPGGGAALSLRGAGSSHLKGDLPFAIEVIASLLSELLEGGDSQHFVVMCEVLRKASVLDEVCLRGKITEFRVRRTYLAYLDLLTKLQLFCEANEIIKASADSYISSLSKQGAEIHTRCAKCGKELTEKSSTAWCLKCARCVCMCMLCNKPVRGLLHWCPVCGHGGHLECTKKWFKLYNTCPTGCGHDCCSSMVELCQETPARPVSRRHSGRSRSRITHAPSSSRETSDKDSSEHSPKREGSSQSPQMGAQSYRLNGRIDSPVRANTHTTVTPRGTQYTR